MDTHTPTSRRPPKGAPELPSRTSAEILEAWKTATGRLKLRGVTFVGGTLSAEALLSALALWFLDLPIEQQESLARRYLPVYEGNLAGTPLGEVPRAPEPAAEPAPGPVAGAQVASRSVKPKERPRNAR